MSSFHISIKKYILKYLLLHEWLLFLQFMYMYKGLQKVSRLMQCNQYLLSYAYKFCREYKTTNVISSENY